MVWFLLASYRLLPRYQFFDQTSLHGTQELVAGQSSVEIYQSSEEQEWIDISSEVNSGFMTVWTVREGWFIWVFLGGYWVVYGVWTFSEGGWISWIRLENRANDECERLVGSDISIIGFLVIMYDMLRFIIRDVANKEIDSSLRTLMFTVCRRACTNSSRVAFHSICEHLSPVVSASLDRASQGLGRALSCGLRRRR